MADRSESAAGSLVGELVSEVEAKAVEAAGGPARFQVLLVLATILALNTADQGVVSAVADQLKSAFRLDNTAFGLLLSVVYFAGAFATFSMGALADRVRRKTVLIVVTVLWTAAMVLSGVAGSYLFLLLTRLFLGAVTAAAWPCVASLTGDFFPGDERAGIYGRILAGELVGAGMGFFISGEIATLLGWRWSFFAMALISAALAGAIWRFLPEPERGTQNWLTVGETDPYAASRPADDGSAEDAGKDDAGDAEQSATAQKIVRQSHAKPREELVLREDPTDRGWIWTIRYCLSIPSYRLLILASALAYFYFAGASAFGMLYFSGHYGLPHSIVSVLVFVIGIGALAGVVAGGYLSERLLDRGMPNARVIVPGLALLLSVPLFGLGLWTRSAWLGVLLMTLAAAALSAGVAPIDAARQDILHPRLWGRGEAGRMIVRSLFEAAAPLVFGLLSGWFGGGDRGLMWTFIVMLVSMIAAGALMVPGRKTYLPDVATAAASVKAVRESG